MVVKKKREKKGATCCVNQSPLTSPSVPPPHPSAFCRALLIGSADVHGRWCSTPATCLCALQDQYAPASSFFTRSRPIRFRRRAFLEHCLFFVVLSMFNGDGSLRCNRIKSGSLDARSDRLFNWKRAERRRKTEANVQAGPIKLTAQT